MGIISTIILGLVVGLLGKFIMPGKDPGGIIVTILIGIAGSFIGHYLAGLLGIAVDSLIPNIIASVIGALILLFAYRKIVK